MTLTCYRFTIKTTKNEINWISKLLKYSMFNHHRLQFHFAHHISRFFAFYFNCIRTEEYCMESGFKIIIIICTYMYSKFEWKLNLHTKNPFRTHQWARWWAKFPLEEICIHFQRMKWFGMLLNAIKQSKCPKLRVSTREVRTHVQCRINTNEFRHSKNALPISYS